MCILACFDDSGNKGNSDNPHLTMSCVAAHCDNWIAFETAWREKLRKHKLSYFHAKDIFTKSHNDTTVEVMKDFIGIIHKYSIDDNYRDMLATSCTIRYKGYEAAKKQIPFLRDIELICYDRCAEIVLPRAWKSKNTPMLIEPCFDAKDHCFLKVEEVWEKADRIGHYFIQRIARPKVDNSQNVCGLQAADLIAWFLNRYYSRGVKDDWGQKMASVLLLARLNHIYLDEQQLLLMYNTDGQLKKNMPPIRSPIEVPKGTILRRQKQNL